MQEFVVNTLETKALVFGFGDFHGEVFKVGKWCDAETKHQCVDVTGINWEGRVGISTMEMHDIWWDCSDWEVIESFIEASMCGNFDTRCFRVTPKDVPGGAWHTPKEDAAARVGDEFCCLFSWRRTQT